MTKENKDEPAFERKHACIYDNGEPIDYADNEPPSYSALPSACAPALTATPIDVTLPQKSLDR